MRRPKSLHIELNQILQNHPNGVHSKFLNSVQNKMGFFDLVIGIYVVASAGGYGFGPMDVGSRKTHSVRSEQIES